MLCYSHQDLLVYVSENEKMPDFNDPSQHIWTLPGLTFGDWYSGENMDGTHNFDADVVVPEVVQNNGSFVSFI